MKKMIKKNLLILTCFLFIIFPALKVLAEDKVTESKVKITATLYKFVTSWGGKGSRDGEFAPPDPNHAYWYRITDSTIENLKDKLDKKKLNILESLKDRDFNTYEFSRETRNLGLGNELLKYSVSDKLSDDEFFFNGPGYIAADSFGNIYVSDYYNSRIQKFDSNGSFITKWGYHGLDNEEYLRPKSIIVDSKDNIYVSDSHYIQKFNSNGTFIKGWRTSNEPIFGFHQCLAIGANDYIYVTVESRCELLGDNDCIKFIKDYIQVFNSEGEFIKKWKIYDRSIDLFNGGKAPDLPLYNQLVINKENNIFTISNKGESVSKFILNDELLDKVQITEVALKNLEKTNLDTEKLKDLLNKKLNIQNLITELKERNIPGCQISEILNYLDDFLYLDSYIGKPVIGKAVNIAIDRAENIFVVDKSNNCIIKFDNSGNFITKFGSFGSGDGQFNHPEAVAADREGNIYVMDTGNYRIQKFSPLQ